MVAVHERTLGDEILNRARGADVLLTNKVPLRRETLTQLSGLKYIGVLATGYDIVDIGTARELGVTVTNIPTYGTNSVAQFACALILELAHRVGLHNASVEAGEWALSPDWTYWKTPQVELAGKTLGIVGFGRIGRQLGVIGQAFGMRVVAHDAVENSPPAWDGFRFLPLEELLGVSDVVSLHCPLNPASRGMINKTTLALMKPTAFLVNSSRGPLIDEADLAAALKNGSIAAAALDVLAVEPPPADHPLMGLPNCIITPHMAWSTTAARSTLLQIAVANLQAFVEGTPVNVVS